MEIEPLSAVVGTETAQVLLDGWRQYDNADALRWFQHVGLDLRLSRKILDVYGTNAMDCVRADPYRLLAFGMSWTAADTLAQKHFDIAPDDERRLAAAVEAVMYHAFDAGHTCCERGEVEEALAKLVGRSFLASALTLAQEHHCVLVNAGRFHALGPYIIEQRVAELLRCRLGSENPLTNGKDVEDYLSRFEQEEASELGISGFKFSAAQCDAVFAVAKFPLAIITGGAGVGKTTVLKVVEGLLEDCGQQIYAMALSGRAAKRLAEATKRTAMTIAGFLRNVAPRGLPNNSALIVDEASMLDILLAHRLLTVIPESCRIIFIGDPYQLPPIGPGLTLHALVSVSAVPRVELTETQRFGGVIAEGALAIRDGRWPSMPHISSAALAFLPCTADQISTTVLNLYVVDPANTQVLTFTRQRGAASSRSLNALCQRSLAATSPRLLLWSDERERKEDTGFRLGEPVLCTRNLYKHAIQNGSLGHIDAIEETPKPIIGTNGESMGLALAWVIWDDGERRPVTEEVLDALELGYAVTVHKAQGSQFPRVVVPVYAARNLDRTMLYTAITRAKQQVILVGDINVARRAVEALPYASLRRVALAEMMETNACL
jgi:exodeoxyribonuclease V alpha subunit